MLLPKILSAKSIYILPLSSSRSVMTAVERVGPAVVRIDLEHGGRRSGQYHMPGEYGGVGSGFIFASDGQILTNAHVVANARRVKVTLADGQKKSK
jgi:serine protease Do